MTAFERVRRRPWILLELALAGLLIAWRLAAPTWHPVWMDLLLYLALYGAWTALFPESRAWSGVTLALMLFALGIYLKHQMPQMLLLVNLLP